LVFGRDVVDATLIRWIVVPVALGAMLIFFRSLLNAHMHIGAVAWVNFATALGSLTLVVPAAVAYGAGHKGALILILCGSLGLGLLLAVYQVLRNRCLPALVSHANRFDGAAVREFLKVALPSLAALFIGMGCVLAVRAAIARLHGLTLAGQFDAAWSISVTFLVVFLTPLQTYLLPRLSASRTDADRQGVLDDALRLSAMIAVPVICSLVILKPVAVRLLYTSEFIHALELLRWTLLGDYIRVSGWVLATTLVARADMRAYLACEIIWNAFFAITALWLLPSGIAGAGPAYVGAYVIYLGVLVWRVCGRHSIVLRAQTIVQWLAGAAIVLLASVLTWSDTVLLWTSLGAIPSAVLFGWVIMRASERQFVVSWLARWLIRARESFAGSWKR
jgi:PST family polysaccharide transporter